MTSVLTIGHSNHPVAAFVELLRAHGVDAVADVRTSPWSRYQPDFNKDALGAALKAAGIAYVFLGRELGGRPEDPACYVDGRVRYDLVARTETFREGMDRLLRGAASRRVALMCAEKEPLDCHRTLLVSRALEREGVAVRHIHADGRLEDHREAMARLLAMHGLGGEDLFSSPEEREERACRKQAERVAYSDEARAASG